MINTIIIALALHFITSAHAVLFVAPGARLDRPLGQITACSDADFQGRCVTIDSNPGQCVNAPSATSIANDRTSSFRIDIGFTFCTVFKNFNCNSNEGFQVVRKSERDPDFVGGLNDAISSYRCSS